MPGGKKGGPFSCPSPGGCSKRGTGSKGDAERLLDVLRRWEVWWWWCSATNILGLERDGGP